MVHRRSTYNHASNNFGVVEHVLRELRTWSSGEWNNLNNLFKITLLWYNVIRIKHVAKI